MALDPDKPLFAPVYEGIPDYANGNRLLLGNVVQPFGRKRDTNNANHTCVL